MKSNLFLCLLFACQFAWADDFKDLYIVGNGQTYYMKSQDSMDATVSIYTASVESNSLNIEYYIQSQNSFLKQELWQQFKLEKGSTGPLKLTEGYILSDNMTKPEKMESKHLKGADGVQMTDFLFGSFDEINKHLINTEEVEVPAGKVKANRYKISNNGQNVEFWISTDSKPLTLLKLISTGKKKHHNYTLMLETLIKNVKPKIKPSEAVALSKATRKILETSLK
ncbi:MAG: hypothetical protein EP326_01950 [Deltaproteobacteria bacterium]|nr:MAG: hypothetical protein EP326_01950 [Deltaproteobacteria bacterium]